MLLKPGKKGVEYTSFPAQTSEIPGPDMRAVSATKTTYGLPPLVCLFSLLLSLPGCNKHQTRLDEIRAVSNELQKTLDDLGKISAPLNPDIKALRRKLETLLAQIDSENELFDSQQQQIRLSKAILANATYRYRDTLTLVTNEDEREDATQPNVTAQIEREIAFLEVKADAFYCLEKWQDALDRYQLVLRYQPNRLRAKLYVGKCYSRLGRHHEALSIFGDVIDESARLVEHDKKSELTSRLVVALNYRGQTHSDLKRLDAALLDFERAIEYCKQDSNGRQKKLADKLANVHTNRGCALMVNGKPEAAVKDCTTARDIYTQLIDENGRADLAQDLATSFTYCGNALAETGKLDAAIQAHDEAIKITGRYIEQVGGNALEDDLAFRLKCRGNVYRDHGKLESAGSDFETAIAILSNLVKKERYEFADNLADTYVYRGMTARARGDLAAAISDHEKAIKIYTHLIKKHGLCCSAKGFQSYFA